MMEEDMFQDHLHVDMGHSHLTSGHSHPYVDHYASYNSDTCSDDTSGNEMMMYHSSTKHRQCHHSTTTSNSANDINISTSHSGVSSVAPTGDYRYGAETRPKNMGVIWIIRVF